MVLPEYTINTIQRKLSTYISPTNSTNIEETSYTDSIMLHLQTPNNEFLCSHPPWSCRIHKKPTARHRLLSFHSTTGHEPFHGQIIHTLGKWPRYAPDHIKYFHTKRGCHYLETLEPAGQQVRSPCGGWVGGWLGDWLPAFRLALFPTAC